MKVAIVIDTWFPFLGGGQINAWEISHRLAEKGVTVDIITRNSGPDHLKIAKNLKIHKLGEKSQMSNQFSRLIFLPNALRYLLKNNYDVIHLYPFLPGLLAIPLRFFKKSLILSVFGTSLGTRLNSSLIKILESFILTKIHYSSQITDSRAFLKVKNVNNVTYIPHGVDIKRFDKVKVKKFSNFTMIFVGRLHPQKNIPNLLKAFSTIIKNHPQTKLIIVGDGPERKNIVEEVKRLNLKKNVEMMGEIKGRELLNLEKSCHLFILPSLYEGLPIALFDAWASKLPVIVSKTGDCQYLVKEGINGYLISNQTSHQKIADVILKAIKNRNLEKMGVEGYKFVKQNFSWDKSAQKTLEVYKKAIYG